jgi:putative peptidoglycan lipid II flippase
MLSEPILSVIYQHNKVTWNDIVQSAAALRYYSVGLAAYAGMKVLAPAFYAIGRRKTPMAISFVAIGLNFGLNSLFTNLGYGHRGLALSTGCVALTNFCLLYWFMRQEIARLETRHLVVTLVKIFLASDVLALVCWGGKWLLLSQWATMGLTLRIVALGLTIGVALVAFSAAAALLKLREMHDLLDAVRRKLSRRKAGPGSDEEAP